MRELKNIEERILDRALYLMGQKKSCDISIRAIAKEADVNVSAINYYFRTKDDMVKMVKEFYIENTLAVLSILKSDAYGDEEKLVWAANEIMEYALQFPGNRVIYLHSMKQAESDAVSAQIIALSVEIGTRLKQLLHNLMEGDERSQDYKYLMFTSSVNYPIEYEGYAGLEGSILIQKEVRIDYLKSLIQALKRM